MSVIDAYRGRRVPFSRVDFPLTIPGEHNAMNASAVIAMSNVLGLSHGALTEFAGAGHRLEKVQDTASLVIYDDYAHHHAQVRTTMSAIRREYPDDFFIAVLEPHQISRYAQNTGEYIAALATADIGVITKFWPGREGHLALPDVNADIKQYGATNIVYIPDIEETVSYVKSHIPAGRRVVILVMGAGQSYKISNGLR
jgi:UDP-N-acetylmuramate--alanine ligase